jgi:hypothetical protein
LFNIAQPGLEIQSSVAVSVLPDVLTPPHGNNSSSPFFIERDAKKFGSALSPLQNGSRNVEER